LATESNVETLRALIHTFVRSFGLLDQTRTPCGMPMAVSDAHALMELLKNSGIEQMELSRRLGLSKSATSRLIHRLDRRGQITRTKGKDDGRVCNLQLSEKGKRQAAKINGESMAVFGTVVSGLSDDAVRHLLEYLPLLIEALPGSSRKSNSNCVEKRNSHEE
jgi:DNA-binding MarR family transcriptional regulator